MGCGEDITTAILNLLECEERTNGVTGSWFCTEKQDWSRSGYDLLCGEGSGEWVRGGNESFPWREVTNS